jgi:hypothetical protein
MEVDASDGTPIPPAPFYIPWGFLSGVYEGLLLIAVGFRAVLEEVNQNKEDSFIYVSATTSAFLALVVIWARMVDPVRRHKCWCVRLELALRCVFWWWSGILESIWCLCSLTSLSDRSNVFWFGSDGWSSAPTQMLVCPTWVNLALCVFVIWGTLVPSDMYLGCPLPSRTVTLLTGVMWLFCCWHETCIRLSSRLSRSTLISLVHTSWRSDAPLNCIFLETCELDCHLDGVCWLFCVTDCSVIFVGYLDMFQTSNTAFVDLANWRYSH